MTGWRGRGNIEPGILYSSGDSHPAISDIHRGNHSGCLLDWERRTDKSGGPGRSSWGESGKSERLLLLPCTRPAYGWAIL